MERHIGQLNRIENSEITQYVFDKFVSTRVLRQFSGEIYLSTNDGGTVGYPHCKNGK